MGFVPLGLGHPLDPEQHGGSVSFTSKALFLSQEDGIDGAGVKPMLDGELFYGDTLLFQALSGSLACLLGYGAGVHSGNRAISCSGMRRMMHICSFVNTEKERLCIFLKKSVRACKPNANGLI